MLNENVDNFVWVERFKPKNLDECILPQRIKQQFEKMIESGNIQNYAAVGSPGSGKTSSARAMCEQLGLEYLIINMSNESGIDTVRSKIVNFASGISFKSDYKVIILDEFDYANKNSAQPALRGVIEEFASNCRFIITANYQNRIIEPLFSRNPIIDFEFTLKEKNEMLMQFIKRIEQILNSENVVYDRAELINFCKKTFPDLRKILNLLQMNSTDGELKFSSLGAASSEKINELIACLTSKDFSKTREWVVNNVQSNDGHLIRRALYDSLKLFINSSSIPDAILLINKYDFQEVSVVDKEINMVAFLLEMMLNLEYI